MRPGVLTAALATLLGLGAPQGLSAQVAAGWRVVRSHVVADLTAGDGGAEVTIEYDLASAPGGQGGSRGPEAGGSGLVSLELLGFDAANASDVRVSGPDVPERRVVLWPTSGSHRTASVRLPDPDGDGRASLRATYRVEAAVSDLVALRGRVPILTGLAAAEQGGVEAFTAELRLPAEWRISEGFPSGLRRLESGVYTVGLPVVPSLIGFRASADGEWRPGVPLMVDVLTLTILLGFAGFGWRHLQGVVSRGADQ